MLNNTYCAMGPGTLFFLPEPGGRTRPECTGGVAPSEMTKQHLGAKSYERTSSGVRVPNPRQKPPPIKSPPGKKHPPQDDPREDNEPLKEPPNKRYPPVKEPR